jgi:hypothetical protein
MAIGVSPENNRKRSDFFRLLFGNNQGYLCIAHADPYKKSFQEEFYRYPEELPQAIEAVNRAYLGHNVWYSAQLYKSKRRSKDNVVAAPCAWSDLDTCPPEKLKVKPTFVIESSPGRFQALWLFDKRIEPYEAEDVSRRIAYAHADQGADRSGWDLTQLLRVPLTYNFKYRDQPAVKVVDVYNARYRLGDFGVYEQVQGYEYTDIPMPEGLPTNGTELLHERRLKISPFIWQLFQETPAEKEWSQKLWNLLMLLFEADFTREEVFAVAKEAACNKFARDNLPDVYLWKDVCRAEAKAKQHEEQLYASDYEEEPLLSPEERRLVEAEDTFIERYIEWARTLGDAAVQYHQAGAFMALSSLLAGVIRLPTSFGTLLPNLWFMILADTTLTRKSTAMDIAMDLVDEVDQDVILATDGSIEGLLTMMQGRPGKPSVFLRDEFSGLLEQITKRDYYAGMPELLTKLYDGKLQKRVLRKEVIEVRDPILIVFAGGIKNKITSLLTFEHVSSGFLPRFVFITAESDITKLKPLGPPTERSEGNRESIRNELEDMVKHYRRTQQIIVKQTNNVIETKKIWEARLTPEAWARYNLIEAQMLKSGMESQMPEITTPVGDRLAKSMLKAAILIAACRQRDEEVVVEEVDIIRAAYYGEKWRLHAREIMSNVGKTGNERQMENVARQVEKHPGITRSTLMRNYHLSARDAEATFSTLEQRGLIIRQKSGKTEQLYPARPKSGGIR